MGLWQRIRNLWDWSSLSPKYCFEWTGPISTISIGSGGGGGSGIFNSIVTSTGTVQKAEFLMPSKVEEIFKNGGNLDDALN